MITRKFENPFYTLVLDYDETRVETDYEKKLVKKYLHFLNRQHSQRQTMIEYTPLFYKQRLMVDDAKEAFQSIAALFDLLFAQQDKINQTKVMAPEEYFKLRDEFASAFEAYQDYHKTSVDPLRICMNNNERSFQKLFDWFENEKDGEAFSKFDDFAGELYKNYNNYSLDLCQYDRDVDNMKNAWQQLNKEWDAFYELRQEINNESTAYCDLLNLLNDRVNRLQIDLIDMGQAWNALNN